VVSGGAVLTVGEASQAGSVSEAVGGRVGPDTDIPIRGDLVFMLGGSWHFIFVISGEMIQDCFGAVPVRDSVRAVQ